MTKTEIMEAAFKVWGRELYFNTSLSLVARELGVSKQALFRHFANKNALIEAMSRYFYDHFVAFIQTDYERALKASDNGRGVLALIRSVTEYFARNVNLFIFSMVNLHDRDPDIFNMAEELCVRGIDLGFIDNSCSGDYIFRPPVSVLIFATLTFYLATFHKDRNFDPNPPGEGEVSKIIGVVSEIIGRGIGYTREEVDTLDFGRLEGLISGTAGDIEDDPLLKAVAGAMAAAGPQGASMEQVALCSGLSKSGLYNHFKSRKEMLYRLFVTEFLRIVDFAQRGIRQSAVPLEQLYLGIFSVAEYLRSKPDILAALEWTRNRRLDFTEPYEKDEDTAFESMRLFEEIDIKPLSEGTLAGGSPFHEMPCDNGRGGGGPSISPWILCLVVTTLMRNPQTMGGDVRCLYRFSTLGIGGFRT